MAAAVLRSYYVNFKPYRFPFLWFLLKHKHSTVIGN